MTSTADFDYYVSDKKFVDSPCADLLALDTAFQGKGRDSSALVFQAVGVSTYREEIPADIFGMMLQSNYDALRYAIREKRCSR